MKKLHSFLFLLVHVAAIVPHTSAELGLCNENNWFIGYNSLAQHYYSAVDVNSDFVVIGGSVGTT